MTAQTARKRSKITQITQEMAVIKVTTFPVVFGADQSGTMLRVKCWRGVWGDGKAWLGDMIALGGVYAGSSRVLRNFMVTSDAMADQDGRVTLHLHPPIWHGQEPADGAIIYGPDRESMLRRPDFLQFGSVSV